MKNVSFQTLQITNVSCVPAVSAHVIYVFDPNESDWYLHDLYC